MPSLKDWWEKINQGDWWLVLVVILVGTLGFGLGRLSRVEERQTPVKLEWPAQSTSSINIDVKGPAGETLKPKTPVTGEVVASSKGTKYHYPNCSGAKAISPANLIHFASAREAEAAGYTLAANCKPK